ncbi:hypothetical protein PGUG_03555 [Meyerozyma guilliermondii ATCC 6260]|uniref:Cytidyltransferase-like domain-containing protein n=1 Tax=Meyerozyma guilliermondii (strain ATCC 6260 / CBS 566 / DSM 6381 / JCM 1539 / NBRC 10279 / NRRL Y-324) TaxID=294746 RepID=A5DJV4_PICGU|nr:uncharacterized protein PGUG_03555 [Meyerozyma guilliermondii ATCC 6260]EDK39457.2 hypothetical protein PGUG_03555 [Meyerozyma guilliermondii ATCC 6260]
MTIAILVSDITANDYADIFQEVVGHLNGNLNSLEQVDVLTLKPINQVEQLNEALATTYSCLRHQFTEAGCDYKLGITILFNTGVSKITPGTQKVYVSKDIEEHIKVDYSIQKLESEPRTIERQIAPKISKKYNVSALGGTFDHIHDGHKILLSVAAFLAKRKLIIGITGQALLKNKKYAECLESFEVRMKRTIALVNRLLDGNVRYDVYEINDVCGPTGFVKDIDCLVVSEESAKGGAYVNNYRNERGFPSLDIITIKVVGGEDSREDNSWKGKISSTDIREYIYKETYKSNST